MRRQTKGEVKLTDQPLWSSTGSEGQAFTGLQGSTSLRGNPSLPNPPYDKPVEQHKA